jgi:hypothetical protein
MLLLMMMMMMMMMPKKEIREIPVLRSKEFSTNKRICERVQVNSFGGRAQGTSTTKIHQFLAMLMGTNTPTHNGPARSPDSCENPCRARAPKSFIKGMISIM